MIGCIRAAVPYGPAVGPNTPRDSWRGWPASGEVLSRGTGARECSGRALIATSPSRGATFEGGSDAATRWNPTGEGFASVPGPPHGSVARPADGRASRDSGCARFVPDGTGRGVLRHQPGPGGHVVPGGRLYGHRRCPRLRVG